MTKYGFADNAFSVNGVSLRGMGEGDDAFQGRFLNDQFSDKVGAQGHMLVIQSADKRGEFIFKCQQGSDASAYLQAVYEDMADDFDPVSIYVKNKISGESAQGRGYISKPADFVRGAGGNDEEWRIVVEDYSVIRAALAQQ